MVSSLEAAQCPGSPPPVLSVGKMGRRPWLCCSALCADRRTPGAAAAAFGGFQRRRSAPCCGCAWRPGQTRGWSVSPGRCPRKATRTPPGTSWSCRLDEEEGHSQQWAAAGEPALLHQGCPLRWQVLLHGVLAVHAQPAAAAAGWSGLVWQQHQDRSSSDADPPSDSLSRKVRRESRYGTCCCRSVSAVTTRPSVVRLLLMLLACDVRCGWEQWGHAWWEGCVVCSLHATPLSRPLTQTPQPSRTGGGHGRTAAAPWSASPL